MLIAQVSSGEVKIVDSSKGGIVHTFYEPGAESADVDGDEVAITLSNGQVKICNVRTGRLVRTVY